jgi:hypothetical protein
MLRSGVGGLEGCQQLEEGREMARLRLSRDLVESAKTLLIPGLVFAAGGAGGNSARLLCGS